MSFRGTFGLNDLGGHGIAVRPPRPLLVDEFTKGGR